MHFDNCILPKNFIIDIPLIIFHLAVCSNIIWLLIQANKVSETKILYLVKLYSDQVSDTASCISICIYLTSK